MKKILIAGIGSGSLGLELLKCLLIDERYLVFGADSNPSAYGFSNEKFKNTVVTRSSDPIYNVGTRPSVLTGFGWTPLVSIDSGITEIYNWLTR